MAYAYETPYEGRDDETLLSLLRSGDLEAYTELWRRHIHATLRLARRLYPSRAEDLASEAFLAVFHQLTVAGNGPEKAFRAYLFTTMRNLAMRWSKDENLVEVSAEVDEIDEEDALATIEDRASAEEALSAYLALPERWQRVLWLNEIEQASRTDIAREFGIKPNAVSALYRRARAGLRLEWLRLQVPIYLQEDRTHVARLLPDLVTYGNLRKAGSHVTDHLDDCVTCSDLLDELRETQQHTSKTNLALAGFAGLSVSIPASTKIFAATTSAGAAATLFAGGGAVTTALVTLNVLAVGGAIVVSSSLGINWQGKSPEPRVAQETVAAETQEERQTTLDSPSQDIDETADSPETVAPPHIETGRWVTASEVPSITFDSDEVNDFYEPPLRPNPISNPIVVTPISDDPHVSDDSSVSDDPPVSVEPPNDTDSLPQGPGLTTSEHPEQYIAPVVTGRTSPELSIVVELRRYSFEGAALSEPTQYAAEVDESGSWALDFRTIVNIQEGHYKYRVWAYQAAEISQPESGEFIVTFPAVRGFEALVPFEPLSPEEAATTGIIFEATGEPGGTICLVSVWPGQSVELQLDANGKVVKRLVMLTEGPYYFSFRACEGDHRGPPFEVHFDVLDEDVFMPTPFGPDPGFTDFEVRDI